MRLVTYSRIGVPSIGVELEEGILDIPEAASRFGRVYSVHGQRFPNEMIDLLRWEAGIDVVRQIVEQYKRTPLEKRPMTHPVDKVRLEAPIPRPGKIIALGLNYKSHIEETGRDVPEAPTIFAKFSSSVIGPGSCIHMPSVSDKIDWEVELGVVIGRICRNVTKAQAIDYVAGYTIINDVSARDLQRRDGQWVRAKSLDGFCPMGPCIVTTDELGEGSGLRVMTKVNDEVKQDSNTSDLLFSVKDIVSYLSQSFTLEPGDVIATGTPSGVGFVRDPPEYLKSGDNVEVSVQGIGTLTNTVE
jgi:acylpyruvate hydrolase